MALIRVIILFSIFVFVDAVHHNKKRNIVYASSEKIRQSFVKERIVPDVLSYPICVPQELVQVSYGNRDVNLGTKFRLIEVKEKPIVSWKANPNSLYTLAKVDPDAAFPRNHTEREYRHWLIVNIRGNNFKSGDEVSSYQGAGAPPFSGFHRYVFLVFKQAGHLDASRIDQERHKFHIEQFAHKYSLGRAIAGNYYLAQDDKQ